MKILEVGETAPSFEGVNQNNEKISSDDYVGAKWVIYFYPKDNTPGCTAQACSLRDGYDALSCLLYTSPSPRDATLSRMPSSA